MFSTVWKKFLSLFSQQANLKPIFRVIDFNQNNYEIKYQLCGKDIIANKSLENLIKESITTLGFSAADQNLLLTLFTEKTQEKRLKIIQISFETDLYVISLLDKENNDINVLTLGELINDPIIKNNLETSDLEKICFLKNLEANKRINQKRKEAKTDRTITVYYKTT